MDRPARITTQVQAILTAKEKVAILTMKEQVSKGEWAWCNANMNWSLQNHNPSASNTDSQRKVAIPMKEQV